MVTITLPVGDTYFDTQVQLDGVTYTLEVKWNSRGSNGFYMNVWDEQGQTLYFAGLKLVCGALIGLRTADRSPPGVFVVVDTSGQGLDPGINDLGARCKLCYMTEAELQAILG